MGKFYLLKPEVAGEFGEQSKLLYKNGLISQVQFLHYEFFGWLGDELLKQSPSCFIVTKSLAADMVKNKLTGCSFENVLITKSDEFTELTPDKVLPEFVRLIATGTVDIANNVVENWSGHDVCLKKGLYLVVTERTLDLLRTHAISHCNIQELN